jgi:hypothetical protein
MKSLVALISALVGSRGRAEPLDLDFAGSVYRFRILPAGDPVPPGASTYYRCDGRILAVEPVASPAVIPDCLHPSASSAAPAAV